MSDMLSEETDCNVSARTATRANQHCEPARRTNVSIVLDAKSLRPAQIVLDSGAAGLLPLRSRWIGELC